MAEKLTKVRVLKSNINLTGGEKGEATESPEVGTVISVREDQIDGGLAGKVRRLSDEPKTEKTQEPQKLTIKAATEFLSGKGYVAKKAKAGDDPVQDATEYLQALGFVVTKAEAASEA